MTIKPKTCEELSTILLDRIEKEILPHLSKYATVDDVIKCNLMYVKMFFKAKDIAGSSSGQRRRAHNPVIVGSNPTPATKFFKRRR